MTSCMSWCQGCVSLLDFKGSACFWTSAFYQCSSGCSHVGFSSGTGHFWTSYAARETLREEHMGLYGKYQKAFNFASPVPPSVLPLCSDPSIRFGKGGTSHSSTIRNSQTVWCVSFSSYYCILIPALCRRWELWGLGKPDCATHRGELLLDFFFVTIKTMAR